VDLGPLAASEGPTTVAEGSLGARSKKEYQGEQVLKRDANKRRFKHPFCPKEGMTDAREVRPGKDAEVGKGESRKSQVWRKERGTTYMSFAVRSERRARDTR